MSVSTFTLAFLLTYVTAVCGNFQLQILHCNDLHARFIETDAYSASCPQDFVKDNKCFGGFARLKEAAIEAGEEAKKQNLPSVFINAGDTFQGTPFYTVYKWQVCAELIAKMGFDVMTIGNHEFDDGIDNLVSFLKNANTPTICSNLNFDSEPRLKLPSLTPSYVMTINGQKIAFIGYLTPETVHMSTTENLEIYPEISSIRAEAQRLKAAGANIIIGLGHSGIEQDIKIAEEIEEISLIVGGHSHTFLYTPQDKPPSTEKAMYPYPTWVTQNSGKKVPVVQAYAFSKYLGKLFVEFDDKGNVVTATGNPILLDGTMNKEPGMLTAVSTWAKAITDKISIIKGYTRTFLGKSKFWEGLFESTLGNLITDSMVDMGVKYSARKKVDSWTIGPVAFYMHGGIRTEISQKRNNGALTVEDIITILPFNNKMMLITLRGSTIRKMLELNVETYTHDTPVYYSRYFVHFSGLRVEYDLDQPAGSRAKLIEILCAQCDTPKFVPLNDENTYQVFTVSFLVEGGDKFEMVPREMLNSTTLEWTDFDCLASYVEKNVFVYPKLDNRIVVKGFRSSGKSAQSASNAVVGSNFILVFGVVLVSLFSK